jgi:hypothetical protein
MTKSTHLRRLVAAGPINGATDALATLLGDVAEHEADAVAIVGDLTAGPSRNESLRSTLRALGEARRPTF